MESHEEKSICNQFFEKKYTFRKSNEWKLPNPEECFQSKYAFSSLQHLKDQLNDVKSQLNNYAIEDWHRHTTSRNPGRCVVANIKRTVGAELVTVAFCKFFEVLNQFPIANTASLNSVHLCEAPGAFITSLNHYLHLHFDEPTWNWRASTLNPYYEGNSLNMITDDRLLLYTLDNWIFGEDFTGNIMSRKNIEFLSDECLKLGSIDLVTADGSIDCTETPDIQEEVVFSLNFAEICAALNLLSEGGSFVLKVFTLFEACMVSVMYFLNCIFEEVSVFKPATSSCGNSEVYVVCVNFLKNTENFKEIFQKLLDRLENCDGIPIFPIDAIPGGYLFEHEICCRLFMGYQTTIIKNNIKTYENPSSWEYKSMENLKTMVCKEFIQRYGMKPIPKSKAILFKQRVNVQYKSNPPVHSGSFAERCEFKTLDKSEQLSILKTKFYSLKGYVKWPYSTTSIHLCSFGAPVEVNVTTCKPIEDVPSSKFVGTELLKHFRKEIETSFGKSLFFYFTKDPIEFRADDKIVRFVMKKSFGKSEKDFFQKILLILRKNKPKKVLLTNFIFLTHFSVSLLRILCSVFEDLRFTDAGEIELENCKHSEWYVLNSIECEDNVFSFIDIIHLHKNDFNEAVTNFNDQLLVKFTENALMSIERSLSII